ncbi:MAG: hypothetical protein ACUVXF_12030 [Desulfobaccales bacterium]
MLAPTALQPLAGWYSSHWSIAPTRLLGGSFIVPTGKEINQPLAALQDLYRRAVFLLSAAQELPTSFEPRPAAAPPSEQAGAFIPKMAAIEVESAPLIPISHPAPHKVESRPSPKAATKSRETSEPKDIKDPALPVAAGSAIESEPGIEQTIPNNFEGLSAKAEVFLNAVRGLGGSLEVHTSLAPELREYGSALVGRFTQSLMSLNIWDNRESLTLNQEGWSKAWQETPEKIAGALCGANSLTPQLVSLAAAIVGAPGVFLLDSSPAAAETYQPFQSPHPWYRVAPVHFYQVA